MPYYPDDFGEESHFPLQTKGEKLVMDYTGLNLNEIQLMELDKYLFYMREAYIYSLNQTEKGREYLENCWRIKQTRPDRQALRKKFGKKGGN